MPDPANTPAAQPDVTHNHVPLPDAAPHDAFALLLDLIAGRYRANARKTLWDVYRLDPDFVSLDADAAAGAIALTFQHRDELLPLLEQPDLRAALVDFFVRSTLAFTYQRNQYIAVDAAEERILRELYAAYVSQIQAALQASASQADLEQRLNRVVLAHFRGLRANLARFFAPLPGQPAEANPIFTQVVCSEYSPAFQLERLGIQLQNLAPPVLDVGCGASGALVKYLLACGIPAQGIDRIVEPHPALSQADWLAYQPEPGAWGSILSHMAFSNHFIFQHQYKFGHPERYARQYMALLGGLKPGGSFYYTPGLPFIESLLPAAQYRLHPGPQGPDRQIGAMWVEKLKKPL